MVAFCVGKRGYYHCRDGSAAYVTGCGPAECGAQPPVLGWRIRGGAWRLARWYSCGSRTLGRQSASDLVAYIGECLRKLPNSPGWWWYEYADGTTSPRQVYEKEERLFVIGGGEVHKSPGRWGDKIEPAGFEQPAKPNG